MGGSLIEPFCPLQDRGGPLQALHNQLCVMSDHTLPPLPVPGTNSTEQASVPKAMAATLGASTPPRPQARSIAGGGAVSAAELLEVGILDEETVQGLQEGRLATADVSARAEYSTRQALNAATTTVSVGKFRGRPVSLWELLFSEAIPAEQRAMLAQQHQEGTLSVEKMAVELSATLEQAAATARVTFSGLRDTVTPGELLKAEIIDQDLYERLEHGQATAQDSPLVDGATRQAFQNLLLSVKYGRFQGQRVSAWELVNSEYFGEGRRRQLLRGYRRREVTLGQVAQLLEAETQRQADIMLPTLRGQVTVHQLLEACIIDQHLLDQVLARTVSPEALLLMDGVRSSSETFPTPDGQGHTSYARLLEQCPRDEASGLHLLPLPESAPALPTKEQVQKSLQAMPGAEDGTSLWDLLSSCHFTEEQRRGMLEDVQEGRTTVPQLLASVQRAMKVPVSTGRFKGCSVSLWDLLLSEYVCADKRRELVALCRSGRAAALRQVVSVVTALVEDAERQPLQATFRGLRKQKGETYVYISETMRHELQSRTAKMRVGRFADQVVSFWDLLSSPYFTEDRKRDLIQEYGTQSGGLEKLLEIITKTIEETETQNQGIKLAAIRGEVTAAELFNSGVIDLKTLHTLRAGRTGGQALSTLECVKPYLEGSGYIAGVMVPSTREVMSLHEASRKELIPIGFATWLLEAQAATGFLLDPCTHQRLSVDEAVDVGLVSEELRERLLRAERAATGYRDPATGDTIPLFQAMQKQLIEKAEALRLLEVQVATGGVIDPRHHHRLPLETAYRRGCLKEDIYLLISNEKHMRKRFVDPNTQEKVSYRELQERCRPQEDTGWVLFPVNKDARNSDYIDDETRRALEAEKVEITVGRFRGKKPTLWALLNSEYVTEEKKLQLRSDLTSTD
ncbi:hypothetical protein H8959_003899 [Pygathrix nigripes]